MGLQIQTQIGLASYSTLKVGGKAEYFAIATSREDLIAAREWANSNKQNLTVLGWGSNTLISDNGVKGLVVINKSKNIEVGQSGELAIADTDIVELEARLTQDLENSKEYYNFSDLDYDESDKPSTIVTMDSGVPWQMAVNYTVSQGLTGLQFFSGIPGTVGGAMVNNLHGGSHFISEYVDSVEVVDLAGNTEWITKDNLNFGYDSSRFHTSGEIVLRVKFKLSQGDKQRALFTSMEWAKRKKIQPARSLGCTWQNITEEQKTEMGLDGVGMGYINDQKLGLKGYRVGKAWISSAHAAFIETEDGATAADVLAIIKHVESQCQEKFNFTPKLEVGLLGVF